MDILDVQRAVDTCLTDEPPPCACACPLGVDVRAMMEKIRDGAMSAAFRLYSKSAVLPGIVSHLCDMPCAGACVRGPVDAAVALRDLERACWRDSLQKPAASFYIPPKDKRVLIVGGGLTGVSCAAKLAGRGYRVRLAERGSRLLDWLWDHDSLPGPALQAEIDALDGLEFLEIGLGEAVEDLAACAWDVALVATGKDGVPQGTEAPGVFLGGALQHPDATAMECIRNGSDLSYAMETYLKIGKREEPAPHAGTCRFRPNPQGLRATPPVQPADPGNWTKEETRREAGRCLLCRCKNCVEVCEVLQWYKKSPRKSLLDIADTLGKTELNRKSALREMMSCTQCGLCSNICPSGTDFRELFIQSRRALHQKGHLPTALYDFWLNDMAFSNGPEASALFRRPAEATPRYLFFPGCQMGASDPGYGESAYRWMLDHCPGETAVCLHCCGAPAYWAGDKKLHGTVLEELRGKWQSLGRPVVVLSCPTCMEQFAEHLPEIETQSLWELMDAHTRPQRADRGAVSVFDPCSSRSWEPLRRSVRSLVEKAGYTIEELPGGSDNPRCCGFGGLARAGSADLVRQMRQNNAALGALPYVTYCTNCRDSFALEGKPAVHILDVLFFPDEDRTLREPPDLTARRRNRVHLKQVLGHMTQNELPAAPQPAYRRLHLEISPPLREKMERLLVHEDNIRQCIACGESAGKLVYDPAAGSFACHMLQGQVTYWVEFERRDEAYILRRLYTHRMQIEEAAHGQST